MANFILQMVGFYAETICLIFMSNNLKLECVMIISLEMEIPNTLYK